MKKSMPSGDQICQGITSV